MRAAIVSAWGKAGPYGPAVSQTEKVEPATATSPSPYIKGSVYAPKDAMLADGHAAAASSRRQVGRPASRARSVTLSRATKVNYTALQWKTPRRTSLPDTGAKKKTCIDQLAIGLPADDATEPVLPDAHKAPDFREASDWPASIGEEWLARRSRTCALSSSSLAPSGLPFSSFTVASFLSLPVQLAIQHTRHPRLHLYDSIHTPPPQTTNTNLHLSQWVSRTVRFEKSRGRHRANLSRHGHPPPIELAHGDDTRL
jgi:hypothetical protein